MSIRKVKSGTIDVKALLAEDGEFLRALVRAALQEVLEAEMTEALSAEKGERCARRSWRDPAGESPAQVRGSARLVTSVASGKVTTTAKRTQ